MSLIRYTPRRVNNSLWRPFGDLQSEINRLFSDAVSDRPVGPSFVPALDVYEKDDRIVVKADLPGVNREDLEISVHEGVLTVRGRREINEEFKEDGFTYVERASGSFSRTVQLPTEVDAEKITAKFKDGILTVEAPKTERAKPKTIQINVS